MNIRAAVSPALNQLRARFAFFAGAIVVTLGMMNTQSAQAQYASQVTIPFAFSANDQAFAAGEYRVFRDADNYLRVVSTETGIQAGLLVHTSRSLEIKPKNSLVFLRDERGFHLLSVRFAQGMSGVQTELSVQPKPEREIAKVMDDRTTEVGMN
ncbi:hypothetical protein [Occallatibacter savannae]|uniref:hypothetical protein n=1 Tax=Occallatibacter savannae TaxID=1002691 RepID=UPI000D69E823|nr:hypothetical protein [Occallatibacter savannae]